MLAFAKADASGLTDKDKPLWKEIQTAVCTDKNAPCKLKPKKTNIHSIKTCPGNGETNMCELKTNSIKGTSWAEIEGYGMQATMTQYIQYSIEDSEELAPNASFNIYLYLKREHAVLDAADTAKPTGITVHRIGILRTPEDDYTGILHDVGTNVQATKLPKMGDVDNYDFTLHGNGLPPGYTDDFREHEFWPIKGEMNLHGGTREGFIVDIDKSSINGKSYKVTLRRTITDPVRATNLQNKRTNIAISVDYRRFVTAEGATTEVRDDLISFYAFAPG